MLYTGEFYDSHLAQYYLRARWYNPLNGRFNRTDPFAGSSRDPQSLHKYLYAHCNPINNIDPAGWFSVSELVSVEGIQKTLRNLQLGKVYTAYDYADTFVTSVNLLNEWRLRGHLDYFALSLLIASLIPFGTLLKKAKIAGKRLIGASDDLTRIFRKAGGRSRKLVQTIGELGAELTARAKGFKPTGFRPPYHSFDGIYKKGSRFIIVEAKGGTSKLAKGQMSKKWIKAHIDKLLNSPDPVNRALAKKLDRAWRNRMVDGMVVTTKIGGDKVKDPEFVFKTFDKIGNGTF